MRPNIPPGAALTLKPDLYKDQFYKLPLQIKKAWRDDFKRQADELGISMNAAVCMAIKFGAPILKAHIELMRNSTRTNCHKIATGGKIKVEKLFGKQKLVISE